MAMTTYTGAGNVTAADVRYVKWEGKTKGGKPIVIELEKAFSRSNPDWTFEEKNDTTPEVEFEGMKLPAPLYFDEYLKHFYGANYMRAIPESKRHSGRKILRIDLGKYLYDETADKQAHIKDAKGELFEKALED